MLLMCTNPACSAIISHNDATEAWLSLYMYQEYNEQPLYLLMQTNAPVVLHYH